MVILLQNHDIHVCKKKRVKRKYTSKVSKAVVQSYCGRRWKHKPRSREGGAARFVPVTGNGSIQVTWQTPNAGQETKNNRSEAPHYQHKARLSNSLKFLWVLVFKTSILFAKPKNNQIQRNQNNLVSDRCTKWILTCQILRQGLFLLVSGPT